MRLEAKKNWWPSEYNWSLAKGSEMSKGLHWFHWPFGHCARATCVGGQERAPSPGASPSLLGLGEGGRGKGCRANAAETVSVSEDVRLLSVAMGHASGS